MPWGCLIEGTEDSSFSEEKEAKRLLFRDAAPGVPPLRRRQKSKSFLLLFFKKEESSSLIRHD
jgi:hypothetical protein